MSRALSTKGDTPTFPDETLYDTAALRLEDLPTARRLKASGAAVRDYATWLEEEMFLAQGEQKTGRLCLYPWQKEMARSFSDNSLSQLTLQMFGQAGKSILMGGYKLYIACETHDPAMFTMPTRDSLDKYLEQKVYPALESNPEMRKKILLTRDGKIPSRIGLRYVGGFIAMGTARAIVSMQSHPAKKILADEIDAFRTSSASNNPLDLLRQRKQSFKDGTLIVSSTPSQHGDSYIEREYSMSDQRQYFMPCVHCYEFTRFLWENVHFEDKSWKLYCENPECEQDINEEQRMSMLWDTDGKWIPQNPELETDPDIAKHRGYWVNQFYSYTTTFLDTMSQYNEHDASGFYTQCLATAYRMVKQEALSTEECESLRGPEPDGPVFAVTVGVDNQSNRVEYSVVRWVGDDYFRLRPYVETHQAVHISDDGNWEAAYRDLFTILSYYKPDMIFVDIGSNEGGSKIKNLLLSVLGPRMRNGRVAPIKGGGPKDSTTWAITQWRSGSDKDINFGDPRPSDKAIPLNTSVIQLKVMDDLKSGWVVLNEDVSMFTEDYYEQLGSMRIQRTFSKAVEKLVWQKVSFRARNEALDCLNYAYAALDYLGIRYTGRKTDPVEFVPMPNKKRKGL